MNSRQKCEMRQQRRLRKQHNQAGVYVVGKTDSWGRRRNINSVNTFRDAMAMLLSYVMAEPFTSFMPICLWVRNKETGRLEYTQAYGYWHISPDDFSVVTSGWSDVPANKCNWKAEGF